MTSPWVAFPLAALTIVALIFVFVRLRFHKVTAGGMAPFLAGAIVLALAVWWNAIESLPGYQTWFVITAYPTLGLIMYGLTGAGLVLIVIGLTLYADLFESRRDELDIREGKLSILQNLQQDTRTPHQLLELLNVSLKEILLQTPERAGAVFLMNRGRRQLILGSSAGLTKNETAYLEHLPLERNVIAQAIELGDPMIAGPFDFADGKGHPVQSRFQSSLVLPLASGLEKIGAIVILAEEGRAFARSEVQYLMPVADWLAEKIHSARLSRDLSVARNEVEASHKQAESLFARLTGIGATLNASTGLSDYCRQVVGIASSNEVHLCGLTQGALQFYGGSEPLADLTEQYKIALIDALDRRKPLIINHESTAPGGRSSIVRSTLVYPLVEGDTQALLLRKEGGPFAVSGQDLKWLDCFGQLAKFALSQRESSKRDLTRRVGFDKVLQLIQPAEVNKAVDPTAFQHHLTDVLPSNSQAVTFIRHENGTLTAVDGFRVNPIDLTEFVIEPGEGILGQASGHGQPQFMSGKKNVLTAIEGHEANNRQAFHRLFGERRLPMFLAVCPLAGAEMTAGVAVFFFFDIEESDRLEWERLLTLASGLFSLRLSMSELSMRSHVLELGPAESKRIAPLVNQLNNHLSAVMGNADLAISRDDISGDLRAQLKSIGDEAGRAAHLVKSSLVGLHSAEMPVASEGPSQTLNDAVETVLVASHIAGDLYMAGGRPREIDVKLGKVGDSMFATNDLRQLFEAVLNRFAAIASEEDVFTVATYQRDNFVYLDVSRHRKNFPPVEAVASFGEYQLAEQALQARPSDVFLKPVASGVCYFASDKTGANPAFLSFKIPLKQARTAEPSVGSRTKSIRILAIDDQEVILDLISAMCQSLGYEVQTASTGTEGVKLAATSKFDIVLTDLAMPDITGLDAARQIRKLHPETPIVLVTGWEAGLDHAEVEAAGITEVLIKPFRIEQLTDIVRSVATRRS